jgi:hypothetical protein
VPTEPSAVLITLRRIGTVDAPYDAGSMMLSAVHELIYWGGGPGWACAIVRPRCSGPAQTAHV